MYGRNVLNNIFTQDILIIDRLEISFCLLVRKMPDSSCLPMTRYDALVYFLHISCIYQVFLLGCPGSQFSSQETSLVFGQCKGGDSFDLWTEETGDSWAEHGLSRYGCEHQPYDTTHVTGRSDMEGVGR
jgi:hypothetical protein